MSGEVRKVNVLFNEALKTFYLRLYGVIHTLKGHMLANKVNKQGILSIKCIEHKIYLTDFNHCHEGRKCFI